MRHLAGAATIIAYVAAGQTEHPVVHTFAALVAGILVYLYWPNLIPTKRAGHQERDVGKERRDGDDLPLATLSGKKNTDGRPPL